MSGLETMQLAESECSSKIVYAEHMLQSLVLRHAPWYSAKEVKTIFYRNLAKDRLQQPRLVDRLKQREQTGGRPLGAVDTMLGLEDHVPEVTHDTTHAPLLPKSDNDEPTNDDNSNAHARTLSVVSRSSQGSLFDLGEQLPQRPSNSSLNSERRTRRGGSARSSPNRTPQARSGPNCGQTAPIGQPRPTLPSPPYKDLEVRGEKPEASATLAATDSKESLRICTV